MAVQLLSRLFTLTTAVASCDHDSWYSSSDSESGMLHLSFHLHTYSIMRFHNIFWLQCCLLDMALNFKPNQ